jgi:hypothetical protein
MRFVPVEAAKQQAAVMLVGVRDRLVCSRMPLANAIRNYAAEFGLTAARPWCTWRRFSRGHKPMGACLPWRGNDTPPGWRNADSVRGASKLWRPKSWSGIKPIGKVASR